MASFDALEAQAQAFHEERAWDAAAILLDGLKLLQAGLAPLEGHRFGEHPEERVMATFLGQALNGLRSGLDLACRGYYAQALQLARSTIEDWLGYWYLRCFPGDHWRFVTAEYEPPPLGEMLRAITSLQDLAHPLPNTSEGSALNEGGLARVPGRAVREHVGRLHPLSHLSRAWVQGQMQREEAFSMEQLGPRLDEAFFRGTVAEMVEVLGLHLEALDNFRRLTVGQPLAGLGLYVEQVRAWERRQAARLRE